MKKILQYTIFSIIFCSQVSAAILPIGWGTTSKKLIEKGSSKIFPNVKGMNLEGDKFTIPG